MFIKQQKNHFVNKHARVTNFLTEKQQMTLVACLSVYLSLYLFPIPVVPLYLYLFDYHKERIKKYRKFEVFFNEYGFDNPISS
jgi:hypothetical protein